MQTESDPKSCQNAKGVQKVAKKDKKYQKRCKGSQTSCRKDAEVANGVLLTSTQCQFRSFITQPTNSVNTMLLLSLEDARLQILLGQRDTLLIIFDLYFVSSMPPSMPSMNNFYRLTTETNLTHVLNPCKKKAKSGPRVCLKCCTLLLLKVQILYRASVSSSNVQILYHAAVFQVQQNCALCMLQFV